MGATTPSRAARVALDAERHVLQSVHAVCPGSLGISQLAGSIEVPDTVLMAGSVIVTLPIIVLFFASERLLTEGLTAGAEKG
jgi:ABC-type glycerol-3-phosphate transport system permease component